MLEERRRRFAAMRQTIAPLNIGWYRVGWDVNTAGSTTGGWTEVRNIPGHSGDATEGGGIVIDDVNDNGRPDFIVLHVDDPAGGNRHVERVNVQGCIVRIGIARRRFGIVKELLVGYFRPRAAVRS